MGKHGYSHPTAAEALERISAIGLPVKFAEHHWKIQIDAVRVDWFPAHGQWLLYPNGKMQKGTFEQFIGFLASTQSKQSGQKESTFQQRVLPWMLETFGQEVADDRIERADRFLEEALELCQTVEGWGPERAIALIQYVFNRPVGQPSQEVGGVMVTLAAFCLAHRMDMHFEAERELARVWTKVEQIRAKQAAKPKGSALPQTVKTIEADEHTVQFNHYANEVVIVAVRVVARGGTSMTHDIIREEVERHFENMPLEPEVKESEPYLKAMLATGVQMLVGIWDQATDGGDDDGGGGEPAPAPERRLAS